MSISSDFYCIYRFFSIFRNFKAISNDLIEFVTFVLEDTNDLRILFLFHTIIIVLRQIVQSISSYIYFFVIIVLLNLRNI